MTVSLPAGLPHPLRLRQLLRTAHENARFAEQSIAEVPYFPNPPKNARFVEGNATPTQSLERLVFDVIGEHRFWEGYFR